MNDERWMREALTLAKKAAENQEVPIGAIVVKQEEIIGQGYNSPCSTNDPTAHAEILAIRNAAIHLGNYRLNKSTLYVSVEPCLMCLGAILHARISRIVFSIFSPKFGALTQQSKKNYSGFPPINWTSGILAQESIELLQTFFKQKRY